MEYMFWYIWFSIWFFIKANLGIICGLGVFALIMGAAWLSIKVCKKQTLPDRWITNDGREIPVTEMTDNHLDNALNYLVRRHKLLKLTDSWIQKLKAERRRRNK